MAGPLEVEVIFPASKSVTVSSPGIQGFQGYSGYSGINATGVVNAITGVSISGSNSVVQYFSLSGIGGTQVILSGINTILISGGGSNVPGSIISGAVTGSGTLNFIPKFNSFSGLGNSIIFERSGKIGVNNTSPLYKVDILVDPLSGDGFNVQSPTSTLIIATEAASTDRAVSLAAGMATFSSIRNSLRFPNDNAAIEGLDSSTTIPRNLWKNIKF